MIESLLLLLLVLLRLLARRKLLIHEREGDKECAGIEVANFHIVCWHWNGWRPAMERNQLQMERILRRN
jgi:hypothetical protein